MTERIDEVDKYYKPIQKGEKFINFLFWTSALLSLVIPYIDKIPSDIVRQGIMIFFIITVILHSIISQYLNCFLLPSAETIRRKQLLSNAFNTRLTPERTEGYYNNKLPPSYMRLGAIILENSFFGKNICNVMAKEWRIKILLYFLIWFIAIIFRNNDLNLVLTLTQILFSGSIIFHWINVELLLSKNVSIFDQLYALFLNNFASDSAQSVTSVLNYFAEYEAAKSSASFLLSSKIFFKLNDQLSKEWDVIRDDLKIDT